MRSQHSHNEGQESKVKIPTTKSATSRKRSRYCPQRRLEVARVRKVGACSDCRRRKVKCSHALQIGTDDVSFNKLPFVEEAFPLITNSNMPTELQLCPSDRSVQQSLTLDNNGSSSLPYSRVFDTTCLTQAHPTDVSSKGWRVDQAPQPRGPWTDAPRHTIGTELTCPDSRRIPSAEQCDFLPLPQNTTQPSAIAMVWTLPVETYQVNISNEGDSLEVFNISSYTSAPLDEILFAMNSSSYQDINFEPTGDAYHIGDGNTDFDANCLFDTQQGSNIYQMQQPSTPCDLALTEGEYDRDQLYQILQ